MKPNSFLPYGKQNIDESDIESVVNVLRSDYLTQGPEVEKFEKEICAKTGAKHCVVVSNGTAALHLAVEALNLPKGSIGHTTTNTFVASANCLSYCGLKTVLQDIDYDSFNMDINHLEKSLSDDSKVVIPVHFAGRPVDMKRLSAMLESRDIKIVEDASHAIGSYYKCGSPVGSCKYSHLTTFSFHPVKTITSGEGGAITTNDTDLFNKLQLLRTHGITRSNLKDSHGPWYYQMVELGFNFRMTDIQATLGLSQLKKLDVVRSRRQELVKLYNSELSKLDWLKTPSEEDDSLITYHLYIIRIDFEKINMNKEEIINFLKEKGIGTQVHYIPVHLQNFYQVKFNYKEGDFPQAERYYKEALSIPLYPTLTDHEANYVISTLKSIEEV